MTRALTENRLLLVWETKKKLPPSSGDGEEGQTCVGSGEWTRLCWARWDLGDPRLKTTQIWGGAIAAKEAGYFWRAARVLSSDPGTRSLK